jgi:hypothetical protein
MPVSTSTQRQTTKRALASTEGIKQHRVGAGVASAKRVWPPYGFFGRMSSADLQVAPSRMGTDVSCPTLSVHLNGNFRTQMNAEKKHSL